MQSVGPLNKHPLKECDCQKKYVNRKLKQKQNSPSTGLVMEFPAMEFCAPMSSEEQQNHAAISSPYDQALDGYIQIAHRTPEHSSAFLPSFRSSNTNILFFTIQNIWYRKLIH